MKRRKRLAVVNVDQSLRREIKADVKKQHDLYQIADKGVNCLYGKRMHVTDVSCSILLYFIVVVVVVVYQA